MNNYDAIRKMSPEQLEYFLDQVYLTGFNYAQYLTHVSEDLVSLESAVPSSETAELAEELEDQLEEAMDWQPYDASWLNMDAEDALLNPTVDEEEATLASPLAYAIFKASGLTPEELFAMEEDED